MPHLETTTKKIKKIVFEVFPFTWMGWVLYADGSGMQMVIRLLGSNHWKLEQIAGNQQDEEDEENEKDEKDEEDDVVCRW